MRPFKVVQVKTNARGQRCGDSHHQGIRYSDDFVEKVRAAYVRGEYGYRQLGNLLDIPWPTIQKWVNGARRKPAARIQVRRVYER
jgi:hypothetical protein